MDSTHEDEEEGLRRRVVRDWSTMSTISAYFGCSQSHGGLGLDIDSGRGDLKKIRRRNWDC